MEFLNESYDGDSYQCHGQRPPGHVRRNVSEDYAYKEGYHKAHYEMEREEERKRNEAAAKRLQQQQQQKPEEEEIEEEEEEEEPEPEPDPEPKRKNSFRDRLARFFGKAPSGGGAVLDW